MRITATFTLAALGLSVALSGCLVVPEEPVVQAPIVVTPPPLPACFEVSQLKRVEVPAETRTVTAISVIENPPYRPIEQRTEQKIITKPAEVFYVRVDAETGNEVEVTNFCDSTVVTGPIGPGEGELAEPATAG